MKSTGNTCAIKLQYPELKWQTKIDVFALRQISKLANKLCKYKDFTGIDFVKFMSHFEKSLFQELDFKQEVINSERCRDFFLGYDGLYLPKVYVLMSSKRSIVMEYVQGDKIDNLEVLAQKYGSARAATDLLIDIFAKMIFLHGHVHCDAHPGNILVRPDPKNPKKPQIILLDHGCYGTTGEKFRM